MGAEQVYALLLRAYPAAFREEYAREMSSAFRRRRREGGAAGAPFWVAVVADVLATAVRLHAEILGRDLRDAWRSLTSRKGRSIVLSAGLAARLWPGGEDPIGRRVLLGNGRTFTVIGVVADVRQIDLALALREG